MQISLASSCLLVLILIHFLHSTYTFTAAQVYQRLRGAASTMISTHDVIVIHENADLSYTGETKEFLSASIAYVNLSSGQITSFSDVLTYLLESQTNPSMLLVYIETFDNIVQILHDYQAIRNYTHQPMVIFVILSNQNQGFETLLSQIPGSIPDLMSDLYFVYTFPVNNSSSPKILLREVYSIRNLTFSQAVIVGPNNKEYPFAEILAKVVRRQNFAKIPIRGVVPGNNVSSNINVAGRDISYSVEKDEVTGETKLKGGYRVEEFIYLRDSLNFTDFGVVGVGYVSLAPNGTLLGIGKDIVDEVADIGVPSSEIVPYRVKYLTFLHPTSDQRLYAFFKQLPPSSVRDIYYQTFSRDLWIVYHAFWISFASLVILLNWIWKKSNTIQINNTYSEHNRVSDFVLRTIAIALQQGSSFQIDRKEPESMKLVIISGLLTSLTLYSAYCGSLVAILMTPVLPIQSFQDILDNRFILYGEKYTLQANSLLTSLKGNRTDYPELDPGNTWGGLDFEADHAIAKIVESKSTLVCPVILFYSYLAERNYSQDFICAQLSGVTLNTYPTKTGMFVKKGSPLKEAFNHKILHMFERGIRKRLEDRYTKKVTVTCFTPGGSTLQVSLGLWDTFTALAVLVIGVLTSFTIFVVEKIVHMRI